MSEKLAPTPDGGYKPLDKGLDKDVLFYIRVGGDYGFYTDPITGQTEVICFELNGQRSGQINPEKWPKEQRDEALILRTRRMLEEVTEASPMSDEQIANYEDKEDAYRRQLGSLLRKAANSPRYNNKVGAQLIRRCRTEYISILEAAIGYEPTDFSEAQLRRRLENWEHKWKGRFPDIVRLVRRVFVTNIITPHLGRNEPVNPYWLEMILTDKKAMSQYIGEENRPHEWRRGDSTKSRTGFWILKPRFGERQLMQEKMSNLKFAIFNALFMNKNVADEYVIQEILPIDSPHNALPDQRGPGVLRLLWDVAVKADGTLQVINSSESIGSVVNKEARAPKKHPQWATFSFKNGVHAVKPSAREIRLASRVQMEALMNIFEANKTEWMPKNEMERETPSSERDSS